MDKIIFSALATFLAVINYIPYIRHTLEGKTKPHVFSWMVWAIITYIGATVQLVEGGGLVGSFVAFTTASISLLIAVLAIRQNAVTITRGDWISFTLSVLAIVLWVVTDRPMLAVILIIVIDFFAFWPTIRKSYNRSDQETLSAYCISTIKHILNIAAQQSYSLVAILFPLNLAIVTFLFTIMLVIRRKQLNLYP